MKGAYKKSVKELDLLIEKQEDEITEFDKTHGLINNTVQKGQLHSFRVWFYFYTRFECS
jgi:hypothetical protein